MECILHTTRTFVKPDYVSLHQLEDWMKTILSPQYKRSFLYGVGLPHCWTGPGSTAEGIKKMARHSRQLRPKPVATPW